MADSELLRFHAESLREYATLWFDPEARQEAEVSAEEAAYHLCEHAAMLFRYTGKTAYLSGLTDQRPESRRCLVLAVCCYVAALTLTETARHLLREDVLDADQITALEDLLIERDAMEEVLSLIGKLSADLIRDGDGELRGKLATARTTVAELDDILLDRQDAVSVAARALAGLQAQLAVQPDERDQWWFGRIVAVDEAFEKESFPELFGNARPAADLVSPARDVIPLSTHLFVSTEFPASLAAADESSGPRLSSLNALIPERPGVRVVVTRLSTDAYQFVFIEVASGERSTRFDGHRLVAGPGVGNLATAAINSGVTVVRAARGFHSCRIETTDGQLVGALMFAPDNQ